MSNPSFMEIPISVMEILLSFMEINDGNGGTLWVSIKPKEILTT